MEEFPSDNPALWSREELEGDGADIEIVDVLEFDAVPEPAVGVDLFVQAREDVHVDDHVHEPGKVHVDEQGRDGAADHEEDEEQAAGADAFARFVALLTEVVREGGGGALAPIVAKVLGAERVDDAIPEPTVESLVAGGILERAQKGLVRTEAFTRTAVAWSRVLRGECDDLAECGPRTLDEWAADVVARILGATPKTEQLRRELRRRGVAAFGLLDAA